MGTLGMDSGVYQSRRPVHRRYVIPMATRHIVQSSLKVKDGFSFVFKMELAWPVPFLLQYKICTHTHTCTVCFFCCLVNASWVHVISLCVISVASTHKLSQSSELGLGLQQIFLSWRPGSSSQSYLLISSLLVQSKCLCNSMPLEFLISSVFGWVFKLWSMYF